MKQLLTWFAAQGKGVRSQLQRAGLAAFAVVAIALVALASVHPAVAAEQAADTEIAVSGTTTWQYRDDNQKPEDGWQTSATVSGDAWKTAAGTFGAKNGELKTLGGGFNPTVLLKQYIDGKDKTDIPLFYFRTTFDVADVAAVKSVSGTVAYDAAAEVFVNGVKVGGFDDAAFDENGYGGSNASKPKTADFAYGDVAKLNLKATGNVLSVILHQGRPTSSDMYLDVQKVVLSGKEVTNPDQPGQPEGDQKVTHVALNVGATETQRNFNWLSTSTKDGEVQVAVAPNGFKAGDAFPTEGVKTVAAKRADTKFTTAKSTNEATVTDLAPSTTYIYRVGNDEGWSNTYTFKTGKGSGSFNFLVAGDPQIGAGSTSTDTQGWVKTMNLASAAFNPDFLFSMGDQINNYNGAGAEKGGEYDGYFAPATTQTLATATEVGNHDEGNHAADNRRYGDSFNMPNRSGRGAANGTGEEGSDYWFTYNGVLFMSLNSNNTSTAEHKKFLEETIAKNPDATWKIVSFHHAIFSTANHYTDGDIQKRRQELSPIFSALKIDAVLMGHDHHYTRTYLMDGQNPIIPEGEDVSKEQPAPSEQTAQPGQVFYLTANSASGSKYYKLNSQLQQGKPAWAAKDDQQDRPSITNVTVNPDSITFTSYYTDKDQPEQFDTFTLRKSTVSAQVSHVALNIGATETQRNFNWLSTSTKGGEVQVAAKPANYKDGDAFPTEGVTAVKAATRETLFTTAKTTNEATVEKLAPSTEYIYRVGNDEGWSKTYSFKTGAGTGDFNFLVAGDPQIGAGSTPTDTQGWVKTMNDATAAFDPDFLFSMGDQINDYNGAGAEKDGQYDGFFAPSQLSTLAFATEVGNHDEGNHAQDNMRYGDSFDMPNRNTLGKTEGTGEEGADYYFVYNNVLFMSLNSNNTSTAAHKQFMEWAIAKNPNVKWKIASFHHAIFSTANHYTDGDIQKRRQELAPVFTELKVDAVLMGHDHHYTRTYLMDGQNPIIPEGQDVSKGEPAPSEQTAKAGQVFYLTANSASGSKYYKLNSELQQGKPAWAAKDDQQDRPSVTDVKVSDDSITFTSYYTDTKDGKPEQFDTFTLKKEQKNETPSADSFTDVKGDQAWVKDEGWLSYALQHGLMSGYKDPVSGNITSLFGPADDISRGQVAAVLYRVANPDSDATTNPEHYGTETGFKDGGTQPYYNAAIKWLKEQGIVTGDKTADGQALDTFRPDAPITRQELAAMVYRFAQKQGADVSKVDASALDKFSDGSEVQPYAREAMAWANKAGLITGAKGAAEGKLLPGQNAQRGQAAKIFTVLHRDVLKLK